MRVFRITTLQHIEGAFSGEGARLYGGRWNPQGCPLVYTAATRSLALLEALTQDQPLRARYAFIPAELPGKIQVERLAVSQLPPDWRSIAARDRLQQLGRSWLEAGKSFALAVPSAVLPQEENYLLNPRHADFRKMRMGEPELLETDSRLPRAYVK